MRPLQANAACSSPSRNEAGSSCTNTPLTASMTATRFQNSSHTKLYKAVSRGVLALMRRVVWGEGRWVRRHADFQSLPTRQVGAYPSTAKWWASKSTHGWREGRAVRTT